MILQKVTDVISNCSNLNMETKYIEGGFTSHNQWVIFRENLRLYKVELYPQTTTEIFIVLPVHGLFYLDDLK